MPSVEPHRPASWELPSRTLLGANAPAAAPTPAPTATPIGPAGIPSAPPTAADPATRFPESSAHAAKRRTTPMRTALLAPVQMRVRAVCAEEVCREPTEYCSRDCRSRPMLGPCSSKAFLIWRFYRVHESSVAAPRAPSKSDQDRTGSFSWRFRRSEGLDPFDRPHRRD